MSTTGREIDSFPPIFKGRCECPQHTRKQCVFPALGAYRGVNPFHAPRGLELLKRKENSSGGPQRRLGVHLRCRDTPVRATSTSQFRNINLIPFRSGEATWRPGAAPSRERRRAFDRSPTFRTGFPYPLGSTNPCPIAVHMEPFSTSALKDLT